MNDEKVSAIGTYVRDDLGPRLAELAQAEAVFAWEAAHRSDTRRRSRKVIQSSVDLLAFCVVPLAGLIVYWAAGQTKPGLFALSVVEALIVVGLGHQVLSYARPSNSPRPPTP